MSGGGGTGETPFSDAFDFSFSSYVTPSLVKLAYGAFVALAAIGYVLAVIITFAVTATTWDFGAFGKIDGTPIPGVLVLALGWIVPFLLILLARVSLEQVLAVVHTAQDVRAMRERAATCRSVRTVAAALG